MLDEPATFYRAAQIIMGPQPPDWFVANLQQRCDAVLRSARANDEKLLKPSELVGVLKRHRDAARQLQTAIRDAHITAWLETDAAGGPMRDYGAVMSVLEDLERRADTGAKAVLAGRGKKRSSVQKYPAARQWCAFFVYAAWEVARRPVPAPTNGDAQSAAETLWLASGGPAWNGHARSKGSWRPYFQQVTADSRHFVASIRANLERPPKDD